VQGSTVAGAAVVVTTQLSGCSYMFETDGGNLVAAHIQPTKGQGYNLVTALRQGASFANGLNAPTHQGVFGAEAQDGQFAYHPDRHTYVIGVMRNGTWELHAQKNHANTATSTPITWQIV
jgi:hypothetical protein